jgi:hypothetical protein
MLAGDMPDDLTETHNRAGSYRGANRLVLSEHAVRMRDHHDAASGDRAGEAHRTGAGGEDLLSGMRGQIDTAVPCGVRRRRRLERPDDPKQSDRRAVDARSGSARTRSGGVRRGIRRPRDHGGRERRRR